MNGYYLTESECPLVKSRLLSSFGELVSGCSTRQGGVSEGIYKSMNLGPETGDSLDKVLENYRIIAHELDVPAEAFVLAKQTHKCNVRTVTEDDLGKGLTKTRDYTDIDALICKYDGEAAIQPVLTILTADCVPVSFYDPEHKAIGLAHSGWRGTVGQITAAVLKAMNLEFGTEPGKTLVSTGPCICRDCYEVSSDVAEEFAKVYNENELKSIVFQGKKPDKFQLDLAAAIKATALRAGVKPENFEIQGLCTNCHPDLLFSHRATGGKRGTIATFLGFRNQK